MGLKTFGLMAVDWEERVNIERLRQERLARIKSRAEEIGDWRAALLRHEQHPLHHRDPYRHLGDGQAGALLPVAAGRRADPLGFRIGGATSSDLLPVAGRALARRYLDLARRDPSGLRSGRRCSEKN